MSTMVKIIIKYRDKYKEELKLYEDDYDEYAELFDIVFNDTGNCIDYEVEDNLSKEDVQGIKNKKAVKSIRLLKEEFYDVYDEFAVEEDDLDEEDEYYVVKDIKQFLKVLKKVDKVK